MATSSITHNFVVSNPNSVKRFVAAIDEADRDRTPKQTLPGRQLTNPQEILALSYDSPAYFAKIFKKLTSQTPSEYRVRHERD